MDPACFLKVGLVELESLAFDGVDLSGLLRAGATCVGVVSVEADAF